MRLKFLLIVTVVLLSPTLNAKDKAHWVIGSFISITNAEKEVERIQQMVGLDSQFVGAIVHGQEVFRIVTEKPETVSDREQTKAALAAIGIQGVWSLVLDVDDLAMIDEEPPTPAPVPIAQQTPATAQPAPAPAPVTQQTPPTVRPAPAPATQHTVATVRPVPAPIPPVPVQTIEPKTVSSEPPFGPDKQSYIDFCIKTATAAERKQYCGNKGFSDQSRKELARLSDDDVRSRALMDYCVKRATHNERKRQCGNTGFLSTGTN